MIMIYKILHGLDEYLLMIIVTITDTVTKSDGYKLYKNFFHLNCRKHFYSQWIINYWNILP